MSVALIWIVSPNSEASNCFGYSETIREGNQVLDLPRSIARDRTFMCSGRVKKGQIQRWNPCYLNADLRYSFLGESRFCNGRRFPVLSSMVPNPAAREMVVSSEQKVYDVVLKQAALFKRQIRSTDDFEVIPDMVLPGTLSLLSEAYYRCGEVCAEYSKTFYLGTLLMTPEKQRDMWAISLGLMSVPVVGIAPESQATTETVYNAALALGIANQLTNILRDVGEDARRGRVYLPQDELVQAGLSDGDIFAGKVTYKWKSFMKKQITRARMFFDEVEKGVTELSSANRWPFWASLLLYRQILDEIESNDYNNFTRRAYVSKPKKILALPVAYAKSLVPPSRKPFPLAKP